MQKEHAERFSDEIERYRRSLIFFAKQCDWDAFKERAERLFDYIEHVEDSELERRFFRTFCGILAFLMVSAVAVAGIDPRISAGWPEHRQMLLVLSLAGCGFEFFFYFNFRQYIAFRTANFRRRREAFIRDLERDFRSFMMPSENARV